jgi:hypothetical protein
VAVSQRPSSIPRFHLRISCHRLLEPDDATRPWTLLQGAGDQGYLAAVAAAVLERLQRRPADDPSHLVLVLSDEGDVELLGAILWRVVDDDHGNAGLLRAGKHRDDPLLGDRLDDHEIELSCDTVIGLAGLQRRVQAGGLNRHVHAV